MPKRGTSGVITNVLSVCEDMRIRYCSHQLKGENCRKSVNEPFNNYIGSLDLDDLKCILMFLIVMLIVIVVDCCFLIRFLFNLQFTEEATKGAKRCNERRSMF